MGGSASPSPPPDQPPTGDDPCELVIRTVLYQTQPGTLRSLGEGDALRVALEEGEPVKRIVCVNPTDGRVVGLVPHVRLFGRLLSCLRLGVGYKAIVEGIDGARVDVEISRG